MVWLILVWFAVGWYEWWRMIRQLPWIAWPHLALIVVYMMLGPIMMLIIRVEEWNERN